MENQNVQKSKILAFTGNSLRTLHFVRNHIQNLQSINYDNYFNAFGLGTIRTVLFNHQIFRENMTALFIIAIAVFFYMCYVLVKPEKF